MNQTSNISIWCECDSENCSTSAKLQYLTPHVNNFIITQAKSWYFYHFASILWHNFHSLLIMEIILHLSHCTCDDHGTALVAFTFRNFVSTLSALTSVLASEKSRYMLKNIECIHICKSPKLGRLAQRKKSPKNSTAWLCFGDMKGTENCKKWKEIWSHIGGLVVHRQKNPPNLGQIGCVCQVLSPWWLQISFHF